VKVQLAPNNEYFLRDEEDGEKVCAMNNNIMQLTQSSVLTAPAVDRGVKPPSPVRANNCLTVCRREEVITRCDSDQTPTRCASSAGQCSNVRRLRLYSRRQCIQWQLSPISEQDECSNNTTSLRCSDNTATTSLEVSRNGAEKSGNSVEYLMTVPSCSFRISAQSYYNVGEENSVCSAVPGILYSLQGQRRIVSDVQPSVGTQPGSIMAISGQTELDGRHSCDSGEDINLSRVYSYQLASSRVPHGDAKKVLYRDIRKIAKRLKNIISSKNCLR